MRNAAAFWPVFGLGRFNHATPSHCLPVSHRIMFTLCCLTNVIHCSHNPMYLTETIQSVSASQQTTCWAAVTLHLIDGLLSTTASHEVRSAYIFTCTSRLHLHHGWSSPVPKTVFNICWLVFVPLPCIHSSAVVMYLHYSSNVFTLDCIQKETINSFMTMMTIRGMWHNDLKIWRWFGCDKCEDFTERSEHHARWKMV